MTTLIAVLSGALAGAAIMLALYRSGMLRERSGLAVLLAAIAFFYPVFAVMEGGIVAILIHAAIFLAFAALAVRAYHRATLFLAGGLIAHGLLDLALWPLGPPGLAWWPPFCAALDIVAGAVLIRLVTQERVPA